MRKVELLSPAGDFESLKAAVQNGANAVYLGASRFNARINGKNFDDEELLKAIEYAKVRNVKVHLTLNILIKNNEFKEAINLVKKVYEAGIDAIIVQDIGTARYIIRNFPGLEVHASTQMTIYNQTGVEELEKLGFSRVVLARELSLKEINGICKNSNIEVEVFAHGALCISYSGQCLMSSMIGGRSGNRGKCAGTCRLPYEIINKETNSLEEKGYLLSSKDVCSLDLLPDLIKSGVSSLKLEGRMKSPQYVGIVTAIYRKYIDLAESGKEYVVDVRDKEKLMQIFNRGGFSTGYISGKLGKNMMYTKKPSHMGIYIGDVLSYNSSKGYVKLKTNTDINLGDSICINDSSCKISELMKNKDNIKQAQKGQVVIVGRLKGRIKKNDKIYKITSMEIENEIMQICAKENVKRVVDCKIELKQDRNVKLEVKDLITKKNIIVEGENVKTAHNVGITKERVIEQLSKTGNTIFEIRNIEIDIDPNINIPIKAINEIRRNALQKLEEKIKLTFKRKIHTLEEIKMKNDFQEIKNVTISLLLNKIKKLDYTKLKNVDKIYIPFSEFLLNESVIDSIINKFNVYLFIPAVVKEKYEELLKSNIDRIMKKKIKGIVISNLSQIELAKKFKKEIIANYTMNLINNKSIEEISHLGISTITISPEINKNEIEHIDTNVNKEIIVYGRTLLMTSEYCMIGTLKNCNGKCNNGRYVLKDRMGFEFPIYTDRFNCNSKIYNSKITSITWKELNVNSIRIDIFEENIEEINKIIEIHKNNKRLEGLDYTNGNMNREI